MSIFEDVGNFYQLSVVDYFPAVQLISTFGYYLWVEHDTRRDDFLVVLRRRTSCKMLLMGKISHYRSGFQKESEFWTFKRIMELSVLQNVNEYDRVWDFIILYPQRRKYILYLSITSVTYLMHLYNAVKYRQNLSVNNGNYDT